jgi:hypothetical protein
MLALHMRIRAVHVIEAAYHSHWDDHHSEQVCKCRIIKVEEPITDKDEACTDHIDSRPTVKFTC